MIIKYSPNRRNPWLYDILWLSYHRKVWPGAFVLSPPHTRGNSLANGPARQFAQLIPFVLGGAFVRISPRKAERKISVMFDIFGLERQIPHRVR